MQHFKPESKRQLIDDDSTFRIEQLQGLMAKDVQSLDKAYHIISIIGSQSSGKSALLNSLFSTDFEELNRKKRVGQTTKGIWYSIDIPSKTMILDVQGSDSNQRQQRNKIQRRNSLFALSLSHTLLINLWIQQIGLFKGSQLSILQIILQINLKLFEVQKPKQVIFVVRDFTKGRENPVALKQTLFGKVQQIWENIPKPPEKKDMKLHDLCNLNAFFLPSKLEQKEEFMEQVGNLRKYLIDNAPTRGIYQNNVAMKDFPQYLKNLWQTIESDKDINLPQEKILLSNMKCHDIKKEAYQKFEQEFRDELQKSERKLNFQFGKNIKEIVNKILTYYAENTKSYIAQQVVKVRQELENELQRKIQISFGYQVKHIIDQCLKQFNENVNNLFIREKNIQSIKALKPEVIKKFQECMMQVCYKQQNVTQHVQNFAKQVDKSFNIQKEKIIIESLRQFDRTLKKQIQNIVSGAFYDKKIFCQCFWKHLNGQFHALQQKVKTSIKNLYQRLQFKQNINDGSQNPSKDKMINEYIQKARHNGQEQLRAVIKMKCHDLLYYIMRHFRADFVNDDKGIPHQWQKFTPQKIKQEFDKYKQKYLVLVAQFSAYELQQVEDLSKSRKGSLQRMASTIMAQATEELLSSSELMNLNKKLGQQMNLQYEQAIKKQKQVYIGQIPKWAWILLALVAFDDAVSWLQSPYLMIPLILIILIVIIIFLIGGKDMAMNTIGIIRSQGSGIMAGLTTQAAKKLLKKD